MACENSGVDAADHFVRASEMVPIGSGAERGMDSYMFSRYELAKFRLKFLNGFPFGAADEFLDENMGKIRELLDLCKKYEELEDQEQIDVFDQRFSDKRVCVD